MYTRLKSRSHRARRGSHNLRRSTSRRSSSRREKLHGGTLPTRLHVRQRLSLFNKLSSWQGLQFENLYEIYERTRGTSLPTFLKGDVTPQVFFGRVLKIVHAELRATKTRATAAAVDRLRAGLVRIHGIFKASTATAVKTAEFDGTDPDHGFTPNILYATNPDLVQCTTMRVTRNVQASNELAHAHRELTAATLPPFEELLCAPDPDTLRDVRRDAFRAFLNQQQVPRVTGVVLNYAHGEIYHHDRDGFVVWTIPPGKSLIMVSMATPGCENVTRTKPDPASGPGKAMCPQVRFTQDAITSLLRARGPTIDPMELAENHEIVDAWNAAKRYEYIDLQRTPITDIADCTYLFQCRPVRVTYFKAGDTCVQKYFQLLYGEQNCTDNGTKLVTADSVDSLQPPFLPGTTTVNFCLSETVGNMYRRGYTDVVFFDLSCSGVLNRSESTGIGEKRKIQMVEGNIGRRDTKRVGTQLMQAGLAGGSHF